MNNTISPLPRLLGAPLRRALRQFPVVVVTGARQTGKTTLVRMAPVAEGRLYRTLDDFDVLERAQRDPRSLVEEAPRMTLDEVQHVPSVLTAIKGAVDRRRAPGRFLLTGSANLLMMRRVSETLAGRAVYLNLWPMTEPEKRGLADPGPWSTLLRARSGEEVRKLLPPGSEIGAWEDRVVAGGYPPSVLMRSPDARAAWFDGYVRTYLERDLQELATIAALADFRRLMKLTALRSGQVINQSNLARDAGLSQPTCHRYLNLLETSFQIVRLPAFAANRTKRLVKSPKVYWTDTGLAAHLSGLTRAADVASSPQAGALVENLVLTQLLAWRETVFPRPEIHYWRTQGGAEVDFVVECGRRVLPVEVKLARRVGSSDLRSLDLFLREHESAAPFGVVLYGGAEVIPLGRRVVSVPLSLML